MKPQSPPSEISLDTIDPEMVRNGRSWRQVRNRVKALLVGSPSQVVEMELKQELALFLSEVPDSTQTRNRIVQKALRRAPSWRKKRLRQLLDRS
jgi:hypothetical protein